MSRAITSVSSAVSKVAPSSSSCLRSASALSRLPLWAMAPGPSCGCTNGSGCAFSARLEPVVEYRVCPRARIEPSPISLTCSGENTWATRPMARRTCTFVPSETAIPADSWPRCCSENKPKYVRFATSTPVAAQIPKTPHIYLVLEAPFPSLTHVRQGDLDLALELERVAARHAQERDLDVMAPRQRLQLRHRARGRADD